MNFKEQFNQNIKDFYWKKRKEKIVKNFYSACMQFKAIMEDENGICEYQLTGWRKNTMGYRGIGHSSGLYSKLRSKSTLELSNTDCVFDHVVGATLCGATVEEKIKEVNYNIQKLIDEWIFDNLYLWGTIKVSKIEHKKDNILRNKNTLDQKINFEHYKIISVSDLVPD